MNNAVKLGTELDIVIHASGLPFNGATVKERSLGGSESAAYYQARELARRGHRVVVFTSHEQGGQWDGVTYMPHGAVSEPCPLGQEFTFYAAKTPHDVLIIQRHPLAFHKDWASKINIWQLHDVGLYRSHGLVHGGFPRIDFTTCVSDWHAGQVKEVYGLGDEAVRAVPNGVDPALYAGPFEIHPTVEGLKAEGRFVCLYQSRPERGLELLLKPDGIMAKLHAAGSRAQLLVCGYDNTTAPMAGYYAQLEAWARALPNVTSLGCLPKVELARLQRSCDLLLYPTEFAEVSCITAMEAMHAGLPVLTSEYAALAETLADAGAILVPLAGDTSPKALDNLIAGNAQQRVDEAAFVRHVRGLEQDRQQLDQLRVRQLKAAPRFTWGRAVDRLEAVIGVAFARRRSPAATLRHLIEHSDIRAAYEYAAADAPEGSGAIVDAAREEMISMYAFAAPNGDPDNLRRHYEHWEGLNCDRLAATGMGNVADEIERFTQSTRFRGILQFVSQAVREAKARLQLAHQLALQEWQASAVEVAGNGQEYAYERPAEPRRVRVMEFGCAHGHVLLPLAQLFPEVEFVGLDFMARSVKMAYDSARDFRLGNVSFSQRDQGRLTEDLGQFDCVIAAEVLEHVWDYEALLFCLAARTEFDGCIVTTTPVGRWEWSGRDNWRKGREHLHHFEAQDLVDLFDPWGMKRDGDMLYAPTEGHDGTGAQLGSWVCLLRPWSNGATTTPVGPIDYGRKFAYLAPRQTVSLCMIVKDGEAALRRGLLHVLPWVDQAVIGVDSTTTDDTRGVLAKLAGEFPQLAFEVFDIETPLVSGFAAARNKTLDRACGDWVLWMDADEELPYASNAWRLLRPSAFNAYACPQIHYSTQPAQVLTTDFPCRLFRHGRGVRFFGTVHEHPEEAPGEAIAHTMMMGDLQFLHSGYVDEAVRRARYQRNLPLLMRDVNDNPERYLNKYLLLRDLSQGLGFEAQLLGQVTEEMKARARRGVDTFVELLALKKPVLRMLIDALPYYSLCVELLGSYGAFDSEVVMSASRVGTPSMTSTTTLKGRFADRDTYRQFVNLIIDESTKFYESKYA